MSDSKKASKKKAKKKVGHTRSVNDDGKTEIEDIEEEVTEEAPGEEVEAAPAHVPETIVTVRGTAVGGTKQMTLAEHEEYCKGAGKSEAPAEDE